MKKLSFEVVMEPKNITPWDLVSFFSGFTQHLMHFFPYSAILDSPDVRALAVYDRSPQQGQPVRISKALGGNHIDANTVAFPDTQIKHQLNWYGDDSYSPEQNEKPFYIHKRYVSPLYNASRLNDDFFSKLLNLTRPLLLDINTTSVVYGARYRDALYIRKITYGSPFKFFGEIMGPIVTKILDGPSDARRERREVEKHKLDMKILKESHELDMKIRNEKHKADMELHKERMAWIRSLNGSNPAETYANFAKVVTMSNANAPKIIAARLDDNQSFDIDKLNKIGSYLNIRSVEFGNLNELA